MIEIDVSPFLFSTDLVFAVTLSWHGLFSFVAVATAVYLIARWAPLKQVDPDVILSVAVWVIIGGVVGARLVHVIDHWTDLYSQRPLQVLYIWTGGIAIWGGVIGGFAGGAGYSLIADYWDRRKSSQPARADSGADGEPEEAEGEVLEERQSKFPVGIIADLTAPALVFVQAIGRLGDIVNGEHCAKATELFFGFRWIHPDSAARPPNCVDGFSNAVQPAIAYEMIWHMAVLVILWKLRGRLKPDGMLFALYVGLYSVGRFGVTFFREDPIMALGMQQAQFIALLALAITVPLLAVKARFADKVEEAPLVMERGTRAVRRRQSRRKARGS